MQSSPENGPCVRIVGIHQGRILMVEGRLRDVILPGEQSERERERVSGGGGGLGMSKMNQEYAGHKVWITQDFLCWIFNRFFLRWGL